MAPPVHPSKWHIGPPSPTYLVWLARCCMLLLLGVVVIWVSACLGGLAFAPVGNDTSLLFNWHPILMTLGFGVFMSEAILSFKAPLLSRWSRWAPRRAIRPTSVLPRVLPAVNMHTCTM